MCIAAPNCCRSFANSWHPWVGHGGVRRECVSLGGFTRNGNGRSRISSTSVCPGCNVCCVKRLRRDGQSSPVIRAMCHLTSHRCISKNGKQKCARLQSPVF